MHVSVDLVQFHHEPGKLRVAYFAAGGISMPVDALMLIVVATVLVFDWFRNSQVRRS